MLFPKEAEVTKFIRSHPLIASHGRIMLKSIIRTEVSCPPLAYLQESKLKSQQTELIQLEPLMISMSKVNTTMIIYLPQTAILSLRKILFSMELKMRHGSTKERYSFHMFQKRNSRKLIV